MRIVIRSALDAAVTEPLLSGRPLPGALPGRAPAAAASASCTGSRGAMHAAPHPAPSLNFWHHFRSVVFLLRPYPALLLALIAVGEALVVAEGESPSSLPFFRGPSTTRFAPCGAAALQPEQVLDASILLVC